MRRLSLILLVIWSTFGSSNAQMRPDSTGGDHQRIELGIDHLILLEDSSATKVISASRSSKSLDDLPITIYVITHEEIVRNHYVSLTDVLKSLPGIKVSQPGTGETGEDFRMRGLTGNYYTKILINNVPIKPSVIGGMPISSQLPIRQAERIEVIYGPAAAVYGADAVTGVVNIILKEADKGTFARGDISLGENEYNYINFMLGGKTGKNNSILKYSFYGSKMEMGDMNIGNKDGAMYNPLYYMEKNLDGKPIPGTDYSYADVNEELLGQNGISSEDFIAQQYPPYYSGGLHLPTIEELPSSSHMIGVQMDFKGIKLSYDNMYRKTHSSLGRTPYLYKYDNPQAFWGENINRIIMGYDKNFRKFTSTTQASFLTYRLDNTSSSTLTYMNEGKQVYQYAASNDIFWEQLFTFWPVRNLETVAGLSYQHSWNMPTTNYMMAPFNTNTYNVFGRAKMPEDSIFNNFGRQTLNFSTAAAFLQTYYVYKKFRFMGGARFDANSMYGNSTSPRFAILYKKNNQTSYRVSLGAAYMAPPSSMAFKSLGYTERINGVDSIRFLAIPNASLRPERFRSLELGLRKKIFWGLEMDLSTYYNEIFNLIVDTSMDVSLFSGIPTPYFQGKALTKINSQSANSKLVGIQATFRRKNIIVPIQLGAELSLTFARSRSQGLPNIEGIISSLDIMPNHMGQLKVSMYPTKNLFIQVENVWMNEWLRVFLPINALYDKFFDEKESGFYMVDVTADYKVGQDLSAFVKVINVFNEEYGGKGEGDLPFTPLLGRNIRIGLTYTLN